MSLTAALDALPGERLRALPDFEFDDPAGCSQPSISELKQLLAAYTSRFVAEFAGMGQDQLAEHLTPHVDQDQQPRRNHYWTLC